MNSSGIQPVEFKVLVKPDDVEERTKGGLYIPDTVRDQQRMAQVKATLVAVGGNAFSDWTKPIPKIGDRLYIGKYTGDRFQGADGETYQLINDKDVGCIILQEKKDE